MTGAEKTTAELSAIGSEANPVKYVTLAMTSIKPRRICMPSRLVRRAVMPRRNSTGIRMIRLIAARMKTSWCSA